MGKKKKKLKELKKEVKRLNKEVKKLKNKNVPVDWDLAVKRVAGANAGESNVTIRKVTRNGILIEGNSYFSEKLVLDHYAEKVNVVIGEKIIEVKTMDGTPITTFERLPN